MAGSVTRAPRPVVSQTKTALRLQDGKVAFDQWLDLGKQLAQMDRSMPWWIGDWAAYGKNLWGREYEPDEPDDAPKSKYREAIDVTGLAYQTIANYQTVADSFPISRRRETLSFQHHAEVASLGPAEQEHWLQLAENEKLSVKALREQLQRRAVGARSGVVSGNVRVTFTIPQSGRELWEEAAGRHDQKLDEWMVTTLNEAAAAEVAA